MTFFVYAKWNLLVSLKIIIIWACVSVDILFGQSWCLMWKTSLLLCLKITQKTEYVGHGCRWRNLEWRNFNEIITHRPYEMIDSSWNYTLRSWYCCWWHLGFYFSFCFFFIRLFVYGEIKWDRPTNMHSKKKYPPLLQISQGVEQHLIVALEQLNGLGPEHHHFSCPIAMAVVLNEWLPR